VGSGEWGVGSREWGSVLSFELKERSEVRGRRYEESSAFSLQPLAFSLSLLLPKYFRLFQPLLAALHVSSVRSKVSGNKAV